MKTSRFLLISGWLTLPALGLLAVSCGDDDAGTAEPAGGGAAGEGGEGGAAPASGGKATGGTSTGGSGPVGGEAGSGEAGSGEAGGDVSAGAAGDGPVAGSGGAAPAGGSAGDGGVPVVGGVGGEASGEGGSPSQGGSGGEAGSVEGGSAGAGGVGGDQGGATAGSGGEGGSIVVQCEGLTDPVNGFVTDEGVDVGDEATYACNEGYEAASGDTERTCGGDGEWTGTALVCQGVACPVIPNEGSFGSWSYEPADRRYDVTAPSVATFVCDNSGDSVSGDNPVTCQSNGAWTGSPDDTYCP